MWLCLELCRQTENLIKFIAVCGAYHIVPLFLYCNLIAAIADLTKLRLVFWYSFWYLCFLKESTQYIEKKKRVMDIVWSSDDGNSYSVDALILMFLSWPEIMGSVEGRTGSSWGTMRLKSASAASISTQRGWGNEGLKWLERIVGVFTMRAGCESRKCSLDWHLEKGNRRSKKGEVYICAFPTFVGFVF